MMRHLTNGFGLALCALLAFSTGCGGDSSDDTGGTGGTDAGMTDTVGGDAGGGDDTGTTDAGGTDDSGTTDAGVGEDTGATDTGGGDDTGTTDAGGDDTGTTDTGMADSGMDAGGDDAGTTDAGGDDAGTTDAGGDDAGTDTGEDTRRLPLRVRAYDGDIEMDDGQGTSAESIRIDGGLAEALSGASVSYSWNGARPRVLELERDTFTFVVDMQTGENTLTVQAARRGEDPVIVERTYYGAIASRAGTYDQMCRGSTSDLNRERCQEVCEGDMGGQYDPTWGNIGGCRNIPYGVSGAGLDIGRPTAPDPTDRVATRDQQCLGSTSDANRARCEELCDEYGGTFDPDWGNIGGCRGMPGSALIDLDFTDGTLYPEEPSRIETRDQQCLGPTSDANRARCRELCEEYGGTHDPDWGNIGGCRDMPGSAGDLDFSDGTIRPDEPDM